MVYKCQKNKKDKKKKNLHFNLFKIQSSDLQNIGANKVVLLYNLMIWKLELERFILQLPLRSLGSKPWKVAYVQPSRRPTDGRYGDNPNRLQHYYQFQVLINLLQKNKKTLFEQPKCYWH